MYILNILILILVTLLPFGDSAYARARDSADGFGRGLTGEVSYSLGWNRYENEGAKSIEYSHLSEYYSLVWAGGGNVMHRRFGSYRLMLGQEWVSVRGSGNMDELDYRISSQKMFYQGDILIAPGGLPFRIHAWSQDTQRSKPVKSGVGIKTISAGIGARESVRSVSVYSDIANGSRQQEGLTVILGIKNGSYQGRFRELLSRYPKLMIDYKQTIVKDRKTPDKEHYRITDLAFISLNKKDNWIHYRMNEFVDYFDRSRDELSQLVTIGLIDHNLNRRWINLTNWIKVSGDINYYTLKDLNDADPSEKGYEVNYMATTSQRGIRSNTLFRYTRDVTKKERKEQIILPIRFSGSDKTVGRWRTSIQYATDNVLTYSDQSKKGGRSIFLSGGTVLTHASGGQSFPGIETRKRFEYDGGELESAGLRYRYAGGTLSGLKYNIGSTVDVNKRTSGDGAVLTRITRSTLTGGFTLINNRKYHLAVSETLALQEYTAVENSNRASTSSTYINYSRNVGASVHRARLSHSGASDSELGQENSMSGQYGLDYSGDKVSANVGVHYEVAGSGMFGTEETQRTNINASVEYDHTTSINSAYTVDYSETESLGSPSTSELFLSQELSYRIMKVNGVVRKLAEFSEKIEYSGVDKGDGTQRIYYVTIKADWYPERTIGLSSSLRRKVTNNGDSKIDELNLSANARYPLLEASVSYRFSAQETEGQSTEEAVVCSIKKTF